MSLFHRRYTPPEINEEAFRLADEWAEDDTSLSLMEYIYCHVSPVLRNYIDDMERQRNDG